MRRTILLLACLICAACSGAAPQEAAPDLPAGDVAAGEALFHEKLGGLPECSACHSLDGARGTGPTLQNYGEIAGSRRGGQDAAQYTTESIVSPSAYVLPGYSNLMPAGYGQALSRQQLADLVAYLLTL